VAPVYDFKILYQKLLSDFEVIVVEKFGYGYSDLYDAPTDVDSLISYHREALAKAGVKGPFILLPHSLSGLEAIRWKQTYPEKIKAIIGLDMAVPAQYLSWGQEELDKRTNQMIKLQKLHKKLFWYPLNKRGLNKEEIKQQKLLWKRNGMNDCYICEAKTVLDNAKIIQLNCGHYVHYYESDRISEEIKRFI
jgi:hypothetical protein